MSSAKTLPTVPCAALLDWYQQHARKLPWRETNDAYAIWVSEIMLQQTQVKTVLPRYQAWLAQFPTIASLAHASEDQVLKAWEGLGYYRRARFLHQAAQNICSRHHGIFPHTFDDILALPGIGKSTAGAIASFCFAANTPVLDANVKRVLRRWHGNAAASEKTLWQWAEHAIHQSQNYGLWNQAMMELGATLCGAKHAQCKPCPTQQHCKAAFQAQQHSAATKKAVVKDVHWQVHIHQHAQHGIWLIQRPAQGIWASLWTPPITELATAPTKNPHHIHQLTHRTIHLYAKISHHAPDHEGQWIQNINSVALPTGIHHLLHKLQGL